MGGPRRRSRLPADRGSVSLWVIIFTFTSMALLILVGVAATLLKPASSLSAAAQLLPIAPSDG